MNTRKLAVYRPNKEIEKGYAFQFSGRNRRNDYVMFVEGTKQVKEKPQAGSSESPFDWKSKAIVMLNSGELAGLAFAIVNDQEIVFTHKNDKGSSILKFSPPDGQRSRNWYVNLSNTRDEVKNTVGGFLSNGDIYSIKLMTDRLILDDVYSGTTEEVERVS